MKINLSPGVTVKHLKDAFQTDFPYLKLEVYNKMQGVNAQALWIDHIKDDTLLVNVIGLVYGGNIEITPLQSVNELEQLFLQKFHLPVQVYRRMGKVWIRTTETDMFSLERQNQIGEEASTNSYK